MSEGLQEYLKRLEDDLRLALRKVDPNDTQVVDLPERSAPLPNDDDDRVAVFFARWPPRHESV